MHQAIPYRSWRPLHNHSTPLALIAHSHNHDNIINENCSARVEGRMVLNMVAENAVIVIGRRGCCMSHVVKLLLQGLGVNPAVYEVEEKDEATVAKQLESSDPSLHFPAVFIGGTLFGGLDRIMATHISGDLVPILKKAGALWL
ncbi:hypothetical protein VNO78_13819 [Psophocarpus tetragonolobus]|uniref:Glutaredoxin domain-containing protein n=1 Tax=Psophocarpus tetragonolobus TaxID=3891 RepID=A0AAN9SQJ0_PSOTE